VKALASKTSKLRIR